MTMVLWMLAAWAGSPCDELEKRLPKGVECQVQAVSDSDGYHAARAGRGFGVEIELLVSRGAPFASAPLNRPVCNGDHLAFRVTPSERGWILVLAQGDGGTWTLLHPPAGLVAAPFAPGEPVRLPPGPDTGFPVTGEPGTEYLLLFVSPTPFTKQMQRDLERVAGVLSPSTRPAVLTGGGTRAFLLVQPSDATATHLVGEAEQRIVVPLDHRTTCATTR